MSFQNHTRSFGYVVCGAALCVFLCQPSFAKPARKAKTAQAAPDKPVSFDELDETESEQDANAKDAEQKTEAAPAQEAKKPTRKSPLPTVDKLIQAKLSALQKKQEEQEETLAKIGKKLAEAQEAEKRTFETNAYLSLKIKNTAPQKEYLLRSTEIYVDGKRIARGGKRNAGLPRGSEVFFGAVQPGCHDIEVKAIYVRQTNELLNLIKVNRVEHVSRAMAFVAKNGYRVEIEIEGFEAQNTVLSWKRGPALRFNRSVRPNFLPGAPIVSMDDVLKQGRVRIDYLTEDTSHHQLIEKSLSIDGLPILVNEKHDAAKDKNIVFDAPLAEGKHKLNVVLLFGEQKRVGGGPLYNFRLTFDRDFAVMSGQTTAINLTGMPHDGFRSSAEDSRYARATTRILSEEAPELFSEMTCKEQHEQELARQQKKIHDDAQLKVKKEEQAPKVEESAPKEEPQEPLPVPAGEELKEKPQSLLENNVQESLAPQAEQNSPPHDQDHNNAPISQSETVGG